MIPNKKYYVIIGLVYLSIATLITLYIFARNSPHSSILSTLTITLGLTGLILTNFHLLVTNPRATTTNNSFFSSFSSLSGRIGFAVVLTYWAMTGLGIETWVALFTISPSLIFAYSSKIIILSALSIGFAWLHQYLERLLAGLSYWLIYGTTFLSAMFLVYNDFAWWTAWYYKDQIQGSTLRYSPLPPVAPIIALFSILVIVISGVSNIIRYSSSNPVETQVPQNPA